jgi:hypothetical protein
MAATDTHGIMEELLEEMFPVWSVPRLYKEDQRANPVPEVYTWATLLLGVINAGTLPCRLEESQI